MTTHFQEVRLDRGGHDTYEEGHCLLEVAAHLAGEPHTDSPRCVSPVLAEAGRDLNDLLNDDRRQRLLGGLAPALVNTRDPSKEHQRSVEWLDWLVRTYLPTWLDLVSLADHAATLRGLPAVSDENAKAAGAAVYAAHADTLYALPEVNNKNARVVRMVLCAARDAAQNTALLDVWGAARVAAYDTAQVAACVAAGEASRIAAEAAARIVAQAAALDVTRGAEAAVWWDTIRSAAASRLAPTVEALQDSAAALLRRQCGL